MKKADFKEIEAEVFHLVEKKDKIKSHALKRVKANLLALGLVFGVIVFAFLMQRPEAETSQALLFGGGTIILGFVLGNLAWRGYVVSLYKKYKAGDI